MIKVLLKLQNKDLDKLMQKCKKNKKKLINLTN